MRFFSMHGSSPLRVSLLVVGSLGLFASACGSPPPAKQPETTSTTSTSTTSSSTTSDSTSTSTTTGAGMSVAVSKADNGKTIEAKVGDTVVLSLDENPSTGYAWKTAKEPDAAVVKVESSAMKMPDQPASGPPMVGQGGVHEWRIRAIASGTTTVSLDLIPPGKSTPAETFTVTIHVSS